MSVNPELLGLSHISYLVSNLSKKNFKASVVEIAGFVEKYGVEAHRHLFRCLLNQIDLSSDGKQTGGRDIQQIQLLGQEFVGLLTKPYFSTVLCHAFNEPALKPSTLLLQQLSRVLKLARVQEVALGLGLLNYPEPDVRAEISEFLQGKLPDLIKSYSEPYGQEGGLHDVGIEIIHALLTHLLQSHLDEIGITKEQLDSFLAALRKDFPKERVPIVLSPLLYPSRPDIETAKLLESVSTPVHLSPIRVCNIMEEMGYYATSKSEVLREVFSSAHLDQITPQCVAHCLGMMARTHTGLSDQVPLQSLSSSSNSLWETERAHEMQTIAPTWNTDVFADVVKSLAPKLNWIDVVRALDHPGFAIKDPDGLNVIMRAYKRGTDIQFPVHVLYTLWANSEGQLSWIKMALSGGSGFSFTDYPHQAIRFDMLNLPTPARPVWTSLDVLSILFQLSDAGHYDAVHALLNYPIKNMPDILFLGVLQLNTSWTALRTDLFALLFPGIISGHPHRVAILQYAWTAPGATRSLILQGMCDWYMKGETFDPSKLSRILEISHELQALTLLLNGAQFAFTIDLAALASRRDFLKLDKWLTEKIREHQESFVSACVIYLRRRLQFNGSEKPGLPQETIGIMLGCLQLYNGPMNAEPAEILRQLLDTYASIIPKPQLRMPTADIEPTGRAVGRLTSMFGGPSSSSSLGLFNSTTTAPSANSREPASLSSLSTEALPGGMEAGVGLGSHAGGRPPPMGAELPPVHGGQGQMASASVISIRQNVIPGIDQSFSREVDDEANSYFQRLYVQSMSVDEVLEILKRLKDSQNSQERDVFMCMLRSLFEEHKFFHNYPDKELQITASLFGGLIHLGLVTYMTLGTALRYVLQALQKPVSDKLYLFGIFALDKFKTRLKEYSQYCNHIAAIPHFREFPPSLIEYVEYGRQEKDPPPRTTTAAMSERPTVAAAPAPLAPLPLQSPKPAAPPAMAGQSKPLSNAGGGGASAGQNQAPSIANPANIETLLVAVSETPTFTVPPDDVQEKVAFMFNNLTLQNLQQKAEEILAMVQVQHLEWLAHYMVLRRISIEPNYHNLYVAYVELHRDGELPLKVLSETYRNIKVLLHADKGDANFSDRSLLKNLGHWLGMFTLAKNRPILQRDLAVKNLLLEAYVRGQQDMLYVVPFVTKVLESCGQKNCVFRPPNPWTMGILGVLVEFHGLPSIKLNLKFEIEVLCKSLSLELKDIATKGALTNADKLRVAQLSGPGESAAPLPVVQKPSFHYSDINVTTLAGLKDRLKMNADLPLFQNHPSLMTYVRPAVERAVQDLIHPVVERSVKIAATTAEHIIKKDFALDPEEGRMRIAAHHMVRHLTAGMAMITCREPLYMNISNNLKQSFASMLRNMGLVDQQKSLIEKAAETVAMENTELASAFIQKTAMEKAVPEMDKRLSEEFELRKMARTEGRRYCNHHVLTYQAERMPEPLRHKVGGVTSQQARVYEEFANCVPGFLPPKQPPTKITQGYPAEEVVHILEKCSQDLQQNLKAVASSSSSHHVVAMNMLNETLQQALLMRGDAASALLLLQRAMDGLLEGLAQPPQDPELFVRFRNSQLLVLKGLQSPRAYGPLWASKHCTRILLNSREEIKFNVEAVDLLIRSQLIYVREFDLHMAQAMENGLNFAAVNFCLRLARLYFVEEKQDCPLSQADMSHMLETLARLAANARHPPEGLTSLLEAVQMNREQLEMSAYGAAQNRLLSATITATPPDFDDPPGLHEKVEYLLTEWVRLYHQPTRDSEKLYAAYLGKLHQHGMLRSDDLISRFFRISTEMCVELCYRNLNFSEHQLHNPALARAKCYHTMDAYVKLIVVLVKHSGDASTTVTKINLLNKVLSTVAHVLVQDHDVRKTEFQQLPYHRLLTMLLQELNVPDPIFDAINFLVLQSFSNTFHNLRPARAPGFAYAWLELVAHRIMIGKLLGASPQQKGWSSFQQLLLDLFRFLAPFLRNAELAKSTQLLYKGTLRVLLVLLHDFPEFLCDYHFSFCDVIPPNCVQMRNLILSAFPRNMRLPDPFTPNLKVDMLPEITHAPRILTNVSQSIQPANFKKDLDSYIQTRAPVTFLSQLRKHLQTSIEPGTRYNVSLMNALVLYVGMQAITYIHSRSGTPSLSTITHSSHMDIFQNLAVDLDTEGRYLFLNAIANQLRFPNSHTHYFSCVLLYLFAEANSEAIQEQITRVLLERLIVNRPHPWGLLITFIELIRNPIYKFWGHSFVHCAPEIEKLFESVARSCMQQKQGPGLPRDEAQEVA